MIVRIRTFWYFDVFLMEKSNSIEREAVTQLKKLIPDLLKEQTELDELLKSDLFNPDAGRYKNVQIWSNESKTILAANSEVTNLLETVAELGFRLAERLDVVKNWVTLSESKITTAHDMTTTARSAMLVSWFFSVFFFKFKIYWKFEFIWSPRWIPQLVLRQVFLKLDTIILGTESISVDDWQPQKMFAWLRFWCEKTFSSNIFHFKNFKFCRSTKKTIMVSWAKFNVIRKILLLRFLKPFKDFRGLSKIFEAFQGLCFASLEVL